RTLFEDIFILPPGSAWTFHKGGKVTKTRYFEPSTWEQQEKLDAGQYEKRLSETFERVVPRYLSPAGKVGVSLTGGLDSRLVLAWARAKPGELPSYTFGGPYRQCADVRLARELAATANQTHQTISVGDEFLRNFPEYSEKVALISDGAMDVSAAI